ncbi:hypothetical protein IKF85_00550 [Candidatus Saccharibacteria bacterium]|nr:hypothetical protein [Candidatus Saccharibacteria bacterium]
MALEINLVPDIKGEMIRTLKLRNFILFLCIVVASASVAVVFLFGVIAGGQKIAIDNKKNLLDSFSDKLNSYSDLNEFLTIKDQVDNITAITSNKKVASRTFNILSALIPTNSPDTIEISELIIDLTEEEPTFNIEAQANAGQAPYIDYNVLDSFKKSMQYMRYDYGNYVDKDGNAIPAYCMIEKDSEGSYFTDSDTKGMYAYWNILAEGCNNLDEKELEKIKSKTDEDESEESSDEESEEDPLKDLDSIGGYSLEDYNGTKVVKIWRTPLFDKWQSESYLNADDGTITGIEHFESACMTYKGEKNSKNKYKWTETNETCLLVPNGTDGIVIAESSNGRSASDELVLRFTANITLAPEVFDFNNLHMIALGPSERRNVTDSYVQIQSIFGERAKDCQEGDTACDTNGGN